jgi:hypothetical protein
MLMREHGSSWPPTPGSPLLVRRYACGAIACRTLRRLGSHRCLPNENGDAFAGEASADGLPAAASGVAAVAGGLRALQQNVSPTDVAGSERNLLAKFGEVGVKVGCPIMLHDRGEFPFHSALGGDRGGVGGVSRPPTILRRPWPPR